MADVDKIFNKIIAGGETWCFAYDSDTKRQSSEWVGETSPRQKKLKFHDDRFFNSLVVVYKKFVPEGKTVNAEFY
jgi:hypothetical protein